MSEFYTDLTNLLDCATSAYRDYRYYQAKYYQLDCENPDAERRFRDYTDAISDIADLLQENGLESDAAYVVAAKLGASIH